MHIASLLTAALTTARAPDHAPLDFTAVIDHAELTRSDRDLQIVAYDRRGEVIGTIALWVEPGGEIFLASDYADGFAETMVTDGRARTEATLPSQTIKRRANAILTELEYDSVERGPQEGAGSWFWCVSSTFAAVGACVGGAAAIGPLIACPGLAASATCLCITAVAEEVGGRPCAKD